MVRARFLEEIRIMRFEELLERHERGDLTQAEAGEMLGLSERMFRRWEVRYGRRGRRGCATGGSASRLCRGRASPPKPCWHATSRL